MGYFYKFLGVAAAVTLLSATLVGAEEKDPLKPRVPPDQIADAKAMKNPVANTPENIAKGKALFEDAEQWIEEVSGVGIFAFDSVCETLGLNPDYLRRGIAEWKRAALAQRTQAKVYQLAPRSRKQRRNVALTRRSGRRWRRAAGR